MDFQSCEPAVPLSGLSQQRAFPQLRQMPIGEAN
jgi:hypothetical protein